MTNRILETVKGRSKAVKLLKSYAETFNAINGKGRMVKAAYSDLEYSDNEGSGEFYQAICLNMNTASSCRTEVWQIETCW